MNKSLKDFVNKKKPNKRSIAVDNVNYEHLSENKKEIVNKVTRYCLENYTKDPENAFHASIKYCRYMKFKKEILAKEEIVDAEKKVDKIEDEEIKELAEINHIVKDNVKEEGDDLVLKLDQEELDQVQELIRKILLMKRDKKAINVKKEKKIVKFL